MLTEIQWISVAFITEQQSQLTTLYKWKVFKTSLPILVTHTSLPILVYPYVCVD